MRILAIESSAMTASAAIVTDDILTAEYTVNFKQTHSQTLLPMIDEICRMTETPVESIDLIAVSAGPGSFTGLRIGSATGKGIGLAINKPVVSVPTLDALVMNFVGTDRIVCPMMDARRGNVYAKICRFNYDSKMTVTEDLMETALISIESIIDKVNEIKQPAVFLGDAVLIYRDMIKNNISVPCILAPEHMAAPRAASVAVLGKILAARGEACDAREHVPYYLRATQAERERANK